MMIWLETHYTSLVSKEVYTVDENDIVFNCHGPKWFLINEGPATICSVDTISAIPSRQLLFALIDLGFSCCLLKQWCLPQEVFQKDHSESKTDKLLSGQILARHVVTRGNRRLQEFCKSRWIAQKRTRIFNNNSCQYDMILVTTYITKTVLNLTITRISYFGMLVPL